MIEQSIMVDDSLLPTADELEKLQHLDPNIMEWMKERCSIEQDARIEFNKDRIKLAKKDMRWFHFNNFISMAFVFAVAIMGLTMSYILVSNNQVVAGSIFGTTGLAVVLYAMRKSNKKSLGDSP
jgi:uncharacterized membrane protein